MMRPKIMGQYGPGKRANRVRYCNGKSPYFRRENLAHAQMQTWHQLRDEKTPIQTSVWVSVVNNPARNNAAVPASKIPGAHSSPQLLAYAPTCRTDPG